MISIESEKQRAKANVALGPPVRKEHGGAACGYGGALPRASLKGIIPLRILNLGILILLRAKEKPGNACRVGRAALGWGYGGALPKSTAGLLAPDPRQGE